MMWHPLLVGIAAMDLFILILLIKAGFISLNVVLNWKPAGSSFDQLQLERSAETADIMIQWAFALMVIDDLLLIWAVTQVLPQIIPGAMCGMGVMQALQGRGYPLFILRCLCFAVLYWQRALAYLNTADPLSPLTVLLARLELLILAFWIMAAYDNLAAFFFHLDATRPVSCCTAVYRQIGSATEAITPGLWQSVLWPITFGIVSLALLVLSVGGLSLPERQELYKANGLLCILGSIWPLAAGVSLIYFLTPYIYQVLGHHCPFCLFLPEHYGVGFFLLFFLVAVSVEAPLPYFLFHVKRVYPDLSRPIKLRRRRALTILAAGVLGFCSLAVSPAILWRVRFGVWL